jgi:hypothetical protein
LRRNWEGALIFFKPERGFEKYRVSSKIYVLVLPVRWGFENSTCLKRGATKKYYNCRVYPQSPPPCTINNERSLNPPGVFIRVK